MAAAKRAAKAAEDQTSIQRQLQVDAAQPYVWVDIRPDDVTGTLLNLVLGNAGPTVATDVRVIVDRPLPAIEQCREAAEAAQELLKNGLPSLPPGRTYRWVLGQGYALIGSDPVNAFTFTVRCHGPFGPVPDLIYVVDLAALHEVLDRPDGNLHQLTRAVGDLGKKIDKLK